MGFVYTRQDEKAVLALLWVLTVFLVVCIVTKVWTSVAAVKAAQMQVEAAIRVSTTPRGTPQKDPAGESDVAERLRQKNLFTSRPPKQNPIAEVTGILGSEALINGRWCQVGDMIAEARVLAVEATHVKVLWEGKMLVYSPVQAGGASTPDSPQAKMQYASSAGQKPAQEENPQTYQVAAPYAAAAGRNEPGRFVVDPPQSRIVFLPSVEEPFRGRSADTLARIRQMAEVARVQQQKTGASAAQPP